MRILFWGDSPAVATGLGNVSKNVCDVLSKEHEITVIGVNDRGGYKDPKLYPYPIYPAIYNNYTDVWGAVRLFNALNQQDPEIPKQDFDMLFVNLDFFLFNEITISGKPLFDLIGNVKIKKVLYTPIDNETFYPQWLLTFKFFDLIIVPSEWAKEVLIKALPELKDRVEVVYYPLDTNNFFKQKPKDKPKNSFIIGYVGRNQWRKALDKLVFAFVKFKERHPNSFLYIHSNPEATSDYGWNFCDLLSHFNLYLGRDYFCPVGINENKGIERKSMRDIYNYMDVFFSASTGEGFGLPYAEASLCEVPVIIPDNTVAKEFPLITYRSLSQSHSFGFIDYNRIRHLPDIEDGLKKLEWVYNHRQEAKEKAKQARKFFLQFDKEKQGKLIHDLIATLKNK